MSQKKNALAGKKALELLSGNAVPIMFKIGRASCRERV